MCSLKKFTDVEDWTRNVVSELPLKNLDFDEAAAMFDRVKDYEDDLFLLSYVPYSNDTEIISDKKMMVTSLEHSLCQHSLITVWLLGEWLVSDWTLQHQFQKDNPKIRRCTFFRNKEVLPQV